MGRTENIKNCLNPEFTKTFEVDYFFEEVQRVMFAIYDIDNSTPALNDDDFLGQAECTMGQVQLPFRLELHALYHCSTVVTFIKEYVKTTLMSFCFVQYEKVLIKFRESNQ